MKATTFLVWCVIKSQPVSSGCYIMKIGKYKFKGKRIKLYQAQGLKYT